MAGKNTKKQKTGSVVMTYTVAECGEFHSMGKYYENIRTLEEAAALKLELSKAKQEIFKLQSKK